MGRNPSFFCFYHHLFFSSKSWSRKSCFYEFLSLQFLFFCYVKPFFLRREFSSLFFENKSCFSESKSFFIKLLDISVNFYFLYGCVKNIYWKRNNPSEKSLQDGEICSDKYDKSKIHILNFSIKKSTNQNY